MSVIERFGDSVNRAISDFFVSILVYLYYYSGKIFPAIVIGTVAVSLLILVTIYGAKSIRRKAIIAIIIVPLVCFVFYYALAIFLSFHSAA